jgi:general secretion pathway protein H
VSALPVPPPAPRSRGFTLIEILVVVVIIGVMVMAVTVAVGALGGDREIEDEAQRIADVVAVTLDQAELEGRDYGLRIEPARYEVMVFDGRQQRWRSVGDDRWFEAHDLPPGLAVVLEVEGRRVLLKPAETLEEPQPQIFVAASGEVVPYRLSLERSATGARLTLLGSADGAIELVRDDAR